MSELLGLVVIANVIFAATGVLQRWPWFCLSFSLAGIFVNEFHKAQHTPEDNRWWTANFLFESLFFVDRDVHRKHHLEGLNY